jgi:hypothetical protein
MPRVLKKDGLEASDYSVTRQPLTPTLFQKSPTSHTKSHQSSSYKPQSRRELIKVISVILQFKSKEGTPEIKAR